MARTTTPRVPKTVEEPSVPNGEPIQRSYTVLIPINQYEWASGRIVRLEELPDLYSADYLVATVTPTKGGGMVIHYDVSRGAQAIL